MHKLFRPAIPVALFTVFALCAVLIPGAKADTLVCGTGCTNTGTAFVWTGIVVTGQETSSQAAPTMSTNAITLWYEGIGNEAVAINNCTANCGTVTPGSSNPNGSNAGFAELSGGAFAINNSLQTTLGPPPSNIPCAENGAQCNYYDYTLSTVCLGNTCLVPGNGTIRDLTLVSVGSGDFILQGNSLLLSFSLPETANVTEPPTLLMLAGGLLGLGSVFICGEKRRPSNSKT